VLANGQEKAFTERRERRTSVLNAAKRQKHAVGPSAVLMAEESFNGRALLANVQCAERAERSRSSSRPAESPQQKPTQVLSAPVSVWSVGAGRGAGRLVRLLCAQVTRTRWRRTSTARGFVVGRTSDAQRATGAALAAGCTRSTAGASEIWRAWGSGLLVGDGR
jgi:hypothetical protein